MTTGCFVNRSSFYLEKYLIPRREKKARSDWSWKERGLPKNLIVYGKKRE